MNSVYIEITNVCNLHCSFCPCGSDGSSRVFMNSGLFRQSLEQVQSIGVDSVYFHVLGEPTLHPGFSLYLDMLKDYSLKLTLTTNGTTIERVGKSILDCAEVRQVNFSTHAYAELSLDEAQAHLQNVLDFCRLAAVKRPDMYINLRLWNVGDQTCEKWNQFFLSKVNEAFQTQVELGHFCSRHKSFNVIDRIYLHEDSRFEWPKGELRGNTSTAPSTKGTCRALDTHAAILHDGRVVACCLDHSGQITLGHIQENSLAEILSSPMATNISEGFVNHELRHPFCQSCKFCKRFK